MAANRDETGGRLPICAATCWGTPCWARPPVRVRGRVLARPAIIREKNTPIDSEVPEFWKVDRIPEATPRYSAGTLDMIEEELGELYIPIPTPFRAISRANAGYGKFTGSSRRPTKLAANRNIPPEANQRAPNRSLRAPDSGPAMKNPTVSGSTKMPAQNGVWL